MAGLSFAERFVRRSDRPSCVNHSQIVRDEVKVSISPVSSHSVVDSTAVGDSTTGAIPITNSTKAVSTSTTPGFRARVPGLPKT
jgi:hypothetical protein